MLGRSNTEVDVTVVHPFDPWEPGLGGFDTFLDGFLRTTPAEWKLEVVGLTRDGAARPVERLQNETLGPRQIDFLPLLEERDPYEHRALPLSLRFAIAGRRRRFAPRGRIVQFHRFESLYACRPSAGARTICFLHNHPPEFLSAASDVRWRRLGRLFSYALTRSLRQLEAAFAVDPRTASWLENKVPGLAGKAFSVPVWADPALFTPGSTAERKHARRELQSRLGLPETSRICLFAGRLETQKDPLLLLQAFEDVASEMPDAVLVFVGRGRLKTTLRHLAGQNGLGTKTHFLGDQDRKAMPNLYRAADVSVCSSAFEGGPRSVFEALACGTPVVTPHVGQVAEPMAKLRDLDLLLQERTREHLSSAILRALALPRTPELAERCAAAVAHATPKAALTPVFDRYERWLSAGR